MYKKIIYIAVIGFFSITINNVNAQTKCDVPTLKTVTFGQKSAAVSNVQACLIQNNYKIAEGATGFYGNKTAQLVKRFYADNKIKVTGRIFGPSGIRIMQKTTALVPAPVMIPVVIPTPAIPVPAPAPTAVQDTGECGKNITYGSQEYRTTKIGDNCWFKDNLNIGEMIQGVTQPQKPETIEKYCYGNDASNCTKFGGLYTWEEAMGGATSEKSKGICPEGWHIPNSSEWGSLYEEVGISQKDANNKTITNIDPSGSMFNKLSDLMDIALNGFRYTNGTFYSMDKTIFFWTSDQLSESRAYQKSLINEPYNIAIGGDSADTAYGMSVRCVRSDQNITLKGFGY